MLVGDATLPCKHLFVSRFPPFYHTIKYPFDMDKFPALPLQVEEFVQYSGHADKQIMLQLIIKKVNAIVGQYSGMPYRESFLELLHAS